MFNKKKRLDTPPPEATTTALEVAAVREQALTIIERVRAALDELANTVELLPGEVVIEDDRTDDERTAAGAADSEG